METTSPIALLPEAPRLLPTAMGLSLAQLDGFALPETAMPPAIPNGSWFQRTVEVVATTTAMEPEFMELDAEDVSDEAPAAKRSCSAAPSSTWLFNDIVNDEAALRASLGLGPRSASTPASK